MTDGNSGLQLRWELLWQRLGCQGSPIAVFDELSAAYTGPGRYYHNFAHVADCLRVFDLGKHLCVHSDAVELAIWFHDAVYDSRAGDNEARSASWADAVARDARLDEKMIEKVRRLILATSHGVEINDSDEQVIVDVDLSILGRSDDVFWQYEHNIRREYAWVPVDVFSEKRREILRGFLRREHIYRTEFFRSKFEAAARINLAAAIDALKTRVGEK